MFKNKCVFVDISIVSVLTESVSRLPGARGVIVTSGRKLWTTASVI